MIEHDWEKIGCVVSKHSANLMGSAFSAKNPKNWWCPDTKDTCFLDLWLTRVIILAQLGTLSEKKRDYVGKIPKLGGGLTQTHFLMSTYQVIFGMPK